jgi:hypothetical protein
MSYPPTDRRAALEPPQFRLRTLLLLVALLCALLAFTTSLDAYGVFAAVMSVLIVAAHLIGATLGHRLRANGDKPVPPPTDAEERFRAVAEHEFAPATKLSQRRRPGWIIAILTAIGLLLGAGGGAVLLVIVNGARANLVNVGSGASAFAVLGGMGGFLLAAFGQEIIGALWEAQRGR